jgi:hypothetical protein
MPNLPASLETVATDLATSLEAYVQTIIDAAENQASEIKREAEQAAIQKQQDSERRAQEILDAVVTRTSRLLGSIELVESSLRGMIGGLRAELDTMTTDLSERGADVIEAGPEKKPDWSPDQSTAFQPGKSDTADGAPVGEDRVSDAKDEAASSIAPDQGDAASFASPMRLKDRADADRAEAPPVSREADQFSQAETDRPTPLANAATSLPREDERSPKEEEAVAAIQDDEAHAAPYVTPLKPASQADETSDAAAEFDQMINAKVKEMVRNGQSRKEVERFLRRFKRGKQYIDQLDGIFGDQSLAPQAPKRGGLSRLWRRR